jgi:histidinol-phosphate aminotransferase
MHKLHCLRRDVSKDSMSNAVSLAPSPSQNQTSDNLELVRPSVTKLRPYVPGKPIEDVKRELGLSPDFPIVKLASNENVLGPSPLAVQAMSRVLDSLWLYPDDSCYALKNRLAAFWDVSVDQLVVGNGSDEIIHFLGLAFLDRERGDEVIFAEPSFVQYRACAMLADCTHHAVPLTSDMRHDLRAMKARVNANTKLIFIANPNNPTGTTVSHDEVAELLRDLPPHVLVVLDQAYLEYVTDENSADGLQFVRDGHNVVVLQTFSKAYALAGLRVGYGIANAEIAGYLQQVRGPFNVNTLAQAAAIASLDDTEQVLRARDLNDQGIEQLGAAFDEMGLKYVPTQANFILVDVGRDAKTVEHELMKRGVIIRTGFGLPQHLRVTIGTRDMNERFISSLREILANA